MYSKSLQNEIICVHLVLFILKYLCGKGIKYVVYVCVHVCVCVWERVRERVCECVWDREREKDQFYRVEPSYNKEILTMKNYPVISGFSFQGKKTKKYKELGPAILTCEKKAARLISDLFYNEDPLV